MTPPGSDAVQSRRRMRRRATLAAAALVTLLIAGIIIVLTVVPDKIARPSDADAPGLEEAVFDGTYQLDYNSAERKLNGALSPAPDAQLETRWAFRSTCTADGCAATGTALDDNDQQVANPSGHKLALHFIDPNWNSLPLRIEEDVPQCRPDGDRYVKGTQKEQVSWTFEPQPDGTLNGLYTATVLSPDCGLAGSVTQISFVATRTSDVPTDLTLGDPVAAPAPETAAPTGPEAVGPALVGEYRFDYADGQTRWWAFRSACSESGCVAVGAEVDQGDHDEATGSVDVLRFADGRWQQGRPRRTQIPCGNSTATAEAAWSMRRLADGSLEGSETVTVVTDECGTKGDVSTHPFVATRDGVVAPNVVLADPTDFQ